MTSPHQSSIDGEQSALHDGSFSLTLSLPRKNAAERNFADIDFKTYLLSTFGLCALRSVFLHPLAIIVTRKQICAETGKKGFLEIASQMKNKEGGIFKAFTQGMWMMTLGSALSETAFNGIYEYGRYYLEESSKLSLSTATAGGAWIADWGSRIVFSPFNVVSVRQMMYNCPVISHHQTLVFQNTSSRHIIRESYRVAGVRSFFCGMGLVLCVGSFTSSVFFITYVNSKKVAYTTFGPWLEQFEKEERDSSSANNNINNTFVLSRRLLGTLPASCTSSTDNFLLNSAASLLGSSLASIIINPYYVMLGQIQSGVAKNSREAFAITMKSPGGPRNFFRGAVSGAAATMFDCWLASSTYEAAMNMGMTVNP